MRERKQQHSTILFTRETTGDCWVGTAQQLIDDGIITLDQLPGMPGMPKVSVSFVNGVIQPAKSRPMHDPSWMRVVLYGNKVRVTCGISVEERDRRRSAVLAEAEAKRKAAGVPDIGLEAATRLSAESSAAIAVGNAVTVRGRPATVVERHRVYAVTDANGRYARIDGQRLDYRPGYVCETHDGERLFWPAHEVKDLRGGIGHIRLVRAPISVSAAPVGGQSSRSAAEATCWPFPIVSTKAGSLP